MTRRALALSPHLDDTTFSCGGRWRGWPAWAGRPGLGDDRRHRLHLLGAVADRHRLSCQRDKGLPDEADYMALRRAEDAAACAALGARPRWLDFAEAPHRGYDDAAALFAAPRAEDAILALCGALGAFLATPPDLILAPQGIGGHVDHVLVALALRLVLPPSAAPAVLWWTDFPYALRPGSHPVQPFAAAMAALPERAVAGDAAARLAACSAYATQLGFQFGGPAGLATALRAAGPLEWLREQGPAPLAEFWESAAA